jgi:hypothetical protein
MAARNRTWTPELVRQKIRSSMLINRLQNHVLGRIEMSKTQLTAARILLGKTVPDLSAISVSGGLGLLKPDDLTDNDLTHIAASGSHRAIEAPPGPQEPDSVH